MARLGADGPERPSGLSHAPVPRWKGTDSFWSGDGDEPPHVHVDHGSKSVKIWLETLKVAYNDGYALHEVNAILNIVERDREQLSRVWHEHFGD